MRRYHSCITNVAQSVNVSVALPASLSLSKRPNIVEPEPDIAAYWAPISSSCALMSHNYGNAANTLGSKSLTNRPSQLGSGREMMSVRGIAGV